MSSALTTRLIRVVEGGVERGQLRFLAGRLPCFYSDTVGLPLTSPCTRVRSLDTAKARVFMKRDDLLGGLVPNGTKLRKFASLLPAIQAARPPEVALIGSPSSNNVVGLTSLLRQLGIPVRTFLCGAPGEQRTGKRRGNSWLLGQLCPADRMHWIPREKWGLVNVEVGEYYARMGLARPFVVQEGAAMAQSLPGLLTLPLDVVLENERRALGEGAHFDHICVEAGTGMTAAALVVGLAALNRLQPSGTTVHVVALAGEETFRHQLQMVERFFRDLAGGGGGQAELGQGGVKVHLPTNARSFGATNSQVFASIADFAGGEGIFLDPVYSAKLVHEVRLLVREGLEGNILVIHQGGLSALQGFG